MEINPSLYSNLSAMQRSNFSKDASSVATDTQRPPLLNDYLPNLVKATVADLIRDELTLTLPNGTDIIAKALNLKNLSIGLEAEFNLSSDQDGNIFASLAENSSLADTMANSALSQALNTLGIKPTAENINIANILLQNEFPITKENFSLLNRAMIMNGNSQDKSLFFMNNPIPLTSKTVTQLNSYINHETELSSQLDTLMENISSLSDAPLKAKLTSLFSFAKPISEMTLSAESETQNIQQNEKTAENEKTLQDQNLLKNTLQEDIPDRSLSLKNRTSQTLPESNANEAAKKDIIGKTRSFSLKPKELSSDNVNDFFNKLSESLSSAKKLLAQSNTEESTQLSKNIDSVRENIDFMASLKDTQLLQFPIMINNRETNADLYVFSNKKNRRKSNGKSANALLALDLAFLGHLEVYIQKKSSDVNCQFRIENDDIETLIKSNMDKLSDYLSQYSLRLSSCSFKTLDTPFSLTDDESMLDSSLENKIKNITFDMRT